MLGSNKTRIVKLEQARGARARRYVFDFDEVAEAEAQGLPYVLAPRTLSREKFALSHVEHAACLPPRPDGARDEARRYTSRAANEI
jgi:hypothetical protein